MWLHDHTHMVMNCSACCLLFHDFVYRAWLAVPLPRNSHIRNQRIGKFRCYHTTSIRNGILRPIARIAHNAVAKHLFFQSRSSQIQETYRCIHQARTFQEGSPSQPKPEVFHFYLYADREGECDRFRSACACNGKHVHRC